MATAETFAIRGTFYHTPTYGRLDALRDVVVVVQNGRIARIAAGGDEATVREEFGLAVVRALKASPFTSRNVAPVRSASCAA
jgi:guanine deaminase